MPTIEENFSKVKEEHLARLLNAYEARSKEFQRLFSSLVVFALIFLFIILLPSIAMQIESHQISDELSTLQNQLGPIEYRLQVYQQVQTAIQDFHGQLDGGPDELHQYIKQLDSTCNSGTSNENQASQTVSPQLKQDCPSDKAERGAWFNQKVQEHVQQQFEDLDNLINDEVVTPLHSLEEPADFIDVAALTNGLTNLHHAFQTNLDKNPSFWLKFEDKISFYQQLDQELDGVWTQYDAEIESQSEKLGSELTSLTVEKNQHEERQQQLVSEETKISDRLNQIEFPFGKFPVGLRESILIFPLVISIGFFLCASVLRSAIRTRESFQSLYQQKDNTEQIINARQISLIAPLPIDPIDSKKSQIVQFAVLLIPFVIFMVACGLTLYSWTLPTVDSGVHEFKWMYGLLYVLGLMLLIYAYQQILTELRHYGRVN